jgi:hypothetical protein
MGLIKILEIETFVKRFEKSPVKKRGLVKSVQHCASLFLLSHKHSRFAAVFLFERIKYSAQEPTKDQSTNVANIP